MEEEELLPKSDLQELNPLATESPMKTGYDAYKAWAGERLNNYGPGKAPDPSQYTVPGDTGAGMVTGGAKEGKINTIGDTIDRINATSQDSTKFSIKTSEISKRYPLTFKGVDNESIYAEGQTLGQKAYNGVAKMVGIGTTTFINGTAGLVYGINAAASAEAGHKIQAFYDNDLANYLNNINEEMEDTYAHYKTIREREGDWWEPNNLFSANFLFDNVIKNLGFSFGALAAGGVWGAGLRAVGMTKYLMGAGARWAAAADAAIAEASALPAAQRAAAVTSKLTQLYNTARSGLGGALMKADRGIVATFGTFGEAGMEALGNSKMFRERMIQEYKDKHGYEPDELEMAKIDQEAASVGNWSFGLNTALLSATNYIQLPKIFASSFKGDKVVANNIIKAGEHYVEDLPSKGFGKLMYKAKNLASLGFNTSEAFEEGAQYAIQTGTQNYFNRKYDGREASVIEDGLLKGVKEALTTGEGTMNIFIGGVSGALQSSGLIGFKKGITPSFGKTGKLGERGWTGYGGEQATVRGEAISALNNSKIRDKMRDAFANIKAAESIQQDRQYAVRKGDILESKDLETDYAHTFIASRLKYGAKEFIDDEIKTMRQEASSEDGWLTLQKEERVAPTDTRESFLKRLDNLQQHADHAAKLYEAAEIKYSGLVDKEGKQVYTDEIIDKLVYAGSKVMDYDRRIPQLQQELMPYGVNTDEILENVIVNGMDADEAMAEGKAKLDKTINADALKTSLSDLVEISLRRKEFVEEYKDISKNPQKYHQVYQSPSATDIQTQIDTPVDTAAMPETVEGYKTGLPITVKTLGGDRTITTGKDYVLGRVVEYDKNGNEVYRAPRLTVLGENPDGTVKVKLFSGEIKDIDKKNLEDYKLVPMEVVKGNEKLRFYMNRWNRVYEHFGIKQNGKPVKGRLEYVDEEGGKLMFVYLDRRKKRKEVEVTKAMFGFDKTKYKHALLKHVGNLTPAEQKEEEAFSKGTDNREASVIKKRMDIMIELSDELIERQEKAEKLIESKRKQIEQHKKEIETLEKIVEKAPKDKRYKKITVFKKDFTRARERALSLVRTIDQLNQEILAQETLIEELDNNLNHIKDFIDNIEQLPVDAHDLVLKMRMDRIDLVEAIQSTGKNIDMLVRARDAAKALLDSTVQMIRDLISAFETKYPGAPYSITQIEAENPDFLKLNENFKSDLEDLGEHLEMMEDMAELPVKEKNIEDLNNKLDEAIQEFKNLENQLRAHDLILNTFKTKLAEYNTQKREEAQMARNQQVAEQLLGTNTKDIQNPATSRDYDPDSKKTWMNAIAGTISPSGKVFDKSTGQWVDSDEEIPEHHLRASRFGARVGVTVDANNVFSYMVSSKTEDEVGLPGLIAQLIGNKKIDPTTVLVAVFVRKNNAGEYELVDEQGEAIPEDEPNKLRKAIFQTFPGEDLPAISFRKELSEEEIKDLKKQYNLWRNSELYKSELPLEPEPMDASFGIPQYPTRKDEKGKDVKIYDTATPAVNTGLITDADLNNKKVVEVNTTGDVYEKGTSSYLNSLGRVFLSLPTGAVKLLNRQFSKTEAEVMYEAIYQLSLNVFTNGNAKNTEAYVLMDWLKSVVHWGIPQTQEKERKDAGYNSIWFEKVTDPNSNKESTRLFVSGLGENFVFTPNNIKANRDLLITIMQNMYNNANVNLVNKVSLTTKYKEIIGFKEGKPIFRTWPNYQTYLISDKMPDSEGNMTNVKRTTGIPWTTNMSPQTAEKPINREGVYFIRRNAYSLFKKIEPVAKQQPAAPQQTPVPSAGPVAQVATGQVQPAAPATAVVTSSIPKGTYDLNGTSPNVRPILHPKTKKQLGGITFTFDGAKALELSAADPTVLSDPAKMKAFSQELKTKGIIKINPIDPKLETEMVMSFQADPAAIMSAMYLNILKESIPQLTAQKVITTAVNNLPTQITTAPIEVTTPVVKTPIGEVKTEVAQDIDPDNIPEDAWASMPSAETMAKEGLPEEAGSLKDFVPPEIDESIWETAPKTAPKEEVQKPATAEVVLTPLQIAMQKGLTGKVVADKTPFKERVADEYTEFDREDWGQTEEWLKQNFPFVPVYRIKNVIRNVNGRQVWGYFQRGAIYVYEGAETGTTYHEVFHAVWSAFAGPKEKTRIVNEFLSRPGSFMDRETLKEVKYSDATPHQIEEKLAEEFRAKTLYGEDPVVYKGKNQGSLIKQLFDDLINFIKTFFTGKSAISNTEKLFNRIGNGYYRQVNPYEYSLSLANQGVQEMGFASPGEDAEMRIENISEPVVQDLISHMTYLTLDKMVTGGVNLFAIQSESKPELYARIKKDILGDPEDMANNPGILYNKINMYIQEVVSDPSKEEATNLKVGSILELIQNVELQWPALVERHQTYLRTFDLSFDENDELTLNKEEETNKSFEVDARTVDAYRKSSPTIRLLLSSLPKTKMVNVLKKDDKGNDIIVPEMRIDKTPINGYYLMPGDQVFNTLMNRLHDSVDSTEMLNRLADIAIKDPTYAHLYEILTKNSPRKKVASLDTSSYRQSDTQLISAFFKSFKKQNAEVIAVYVLPGGDVSIGDAALASAAKQVKSEYFNNTLYSLRKKDTYVKYDDASQTYTATDKIKNYNFGKGEEEAYLNLLKNLDIDFTQEDYGLLDGNQRKLFKEIVPGIQKSISSINGFKSLTNKSVNLEGRLLQLASLKVIANKVASGDPVFESTYFNINNERSQSFIGVNLMSNFYDVISKLKNYKDLVNTPFKYLQTDAFSKDKGSLFMNKLFDIAGDGTRIEGTEGLGKTVYVDGTIDQESGKKKESSKLTYLQRFTQELSLNFNGYFSNLVPGDASIEWVVKMFHKDSPFSSESDVNDKSYLGIFKDYFISEVLLSRDDRTIPNVKGRSNKDLRFFKDILRDPNSSEPDALHDSIISSTATPEKVYEDFKTRIEAAVERFVETEAKDTREVLKSYDLIKYDEEGNLEVKKVDLNLGDKVLTSELLNEKLKFISVNYMIANIEYHKLIYSDPYQYKDELKRIKNFNSPRQALITGDDNLMEAFTRTYNEGIDKDSPFYTDFSKTYFDTVTWEDGISTNTDLGYDPFEDTDGGGEIIMKANRWFRILAGDWSDACEAQFRHDVQYEAIAKGKGTPEEIQKKLDEHEKDNPAVSDAYRALKPIVAGAKENDRNYNDVLLDKYALVVSSYRIWHKLNPNSNALKKYLKMQREGIDYGVYSTGRKVGAEVLSPIYNENGQFDETPYRNAEQEANPSLPQAVIKVPHEIISVQVEVPTKTVAKTTEGSQLTQLATLDYMNAGMPVDFNPAVPGQENMTEDELFNAQFQVWEGMSEDKKKEISPLYKEIQNNKELLEARIQQGYENLLIKTGIKETPDGFYIADRERLIDTLTDEILKREVNENIIDAFKEVKSGKVVMEATPAYKQIRNILYSMANQAVATKKISGKMAVQITERTLEEGDIKVTQVKNSKGKMINVYNSDNLKFYKNEDGKRVCEIMVGRWFDSKKTDEELIEYLNTTDEGQKILQGVAFRIPTQKQNSIDSFVIKQFLPKEYGDNVVIPAALVKKVGSDFDIDKLSMYFKNVKNNKDGFPELIKLKDDSNSNVNQRYIEYVSEHVKEFKTKGVESDLDSEEVSKVFDVLDLNIAMALAQEEGLEDINTFSQRSILMQNTPKAVDNAYQESLFQLITHPMNFERLILPNSAQQLIVLNNEIQEALKTGETDYTSVGNMLKRGFMSKLRHAFVTGKQAIGIAAVGQTNNANNQKGPMVIEDERLALLSDKDKKWIGDASIRFSQYNSILYKGKIRPTLSKAKNKAGEYISDIVGMFIDGYVDIAKGPWIMEMGATPNVAGTWLTLIKFGVPVRSVAMFMNQPIIKEYLKKIESAGYSYLFIDDFFNGSIDSFEPNEDISNDFPVIPNDKLLKDMIGKTPDELSDLQKAQQQFILKEFIKYAKIGEHLFFITQGSNYNTASFNDPFLFLQKEMQLEKARRTIFSSVDNILDYTHIGALKKAFGKIRNAFAELLISDKVTKPNGVMGTRELFTKLLMPYVERPSKEFLKISQKAVVDLFDWVIQTQGEKNRNKYVAEILIGTEGVDSAADAVMKYKAYVAGKDDHPLKNNLVLNSFQRKTNSKEGGIEALYINGKNNKVYEQNLIINSFRELQKELELEKNDLYQRIVGLTILQSGLSTSPISFTHLLPYEDFINTYNELLVNLDTNPNLHKFLDLNVFERVNWSDSTIVPFKPFKLTKTKPGSKRKFVNTNMDFLDPRLVSAKNNKQIPMVINISEMGQEGNYDVITYTWQPNSTLTAYQKGQMRRNGDYSYMKKGLFQKVYTEIDGVRVPYVQKREYNGVTYTNYVYKQINAWGDSFRGREMYDVLQPSLFDNGYEKVVRTPADTSQPALTSGEVDDATIINILGGYPENVVPLEEAGPIDERVTAVIGVKYDPKFGVTEEAWNALSTEEQQEIKDQNENC